MVVSVDYGFQYKASGILLNGNNNVPTIGNPIYDIYSVEGLDMTPQQVSTKNYEGRDGGYVEARFFKIRTVVLRGTVIAHKDDSMESILDAMKYNFRPLVKEDNLFFKAPGIGERRLLCKPTAFTYVWDQSRRFNSCTFQLIFQAQDPITYGTTRKFYTPAVGSIVAVNNSGNAPTPLYTTITGACVSPWINNHSTSPVTSLKLSNYTQPAGDRLFVDNQLHTANSQVIATGVFTNRRTTVVNESWWYVPPGNSNISVTVTSGTPTIIFEFDEGWL